MGRSAACGDVTPQEELNLDRFFPLMWEYDYFKAQHRCCSTFSDPHVGIFSPAADLACVVEDLIVSLSRQPIGLSRTPQMENSDQLSAR